MLRVRPLIATPDLPGAARFLRELGLHPTGDPVPAGTSAVFDTGSGRVALRRCAPGSPGEGTTALAFEVADVREFARRTAEAGTAVGLTEGGSGLTARITAPDGTSFPAAAGPRTTGAPPSPLAVLVVWSSSDAGSAARVLEDIGARPRTGSGAGTRPDVGSKHFSAKNGGFVAVRAAERTGMELAFEFDGDVRDLAGALTAAGSEPVVVGDGSGRSLLVRAPWGAEVRILEPRGGRSGGTAH